MRRRVAAVLAGALLAGGLAGCKDVRKDCEDRGGHLAYVAKMYRCVGVH